MSDWAQFEAIEGNDYWIRQVKCQAACPVHTNACGYVTAIAEGRYADAYRTARATNPFASICGRVCGAPCEVNCRRGDIDDPITIRALKRFVTDKFGPESDNGSLYQEGCDRRMLPPNRGNYERIAVVGAGVSGLTVAHDLTLIGYKVTLFEANSEPGGMLTVGVPVFRLPRELVKKEIEAILALGVELKCNMRLGRDFSIDDLRLQGFKAIFLGIGLPKGRKLALPGADRPMVYDGMDFLRAFNEGKPMPLGKRIVVIGGGNVAYDVARSAVRAAEPTATHGEALSDMERGEQIAYDVARSALRLSSDKEVHVVCLEKREEMPADDVEVFEGAEEGLRLHNARGPKAIFGENGTVTGLRTIRCVSVFDAAGRFNPTFDDADIEDIPADTIIFAIGQSADLSFLKPEDGVQTERRLIKVNRDTYQTTAPDVFACGDIAHGARLFIDAIASAQIAARSMHDFLRGTRTDIVVRSQWAPAVYTMAEGWERLDRANPPVIEAAQRSASLDIIEESFPADEAHRQASRCLRCNVNTVFDTTTCIGCNGCVDVCPQSIIRLVGLSELCQDERWVGMVAETLGLFREQLNAMDKPELDALGGVMLKDETTCIRCGLCASRCPTHAVTMKRFEFYRECVTIPTRNEKLLYPINGHHASASSLRSTP
jgi:formate dehydrogenase (NADP+) beta subunit